MPRQNRTITAEDIMDLGTYETIRPEKREEAILRKRFRRLSVGPHVTVTFENWDSMWLQVQEMLRIEKGGAEQLVDELAAYNPMIPNGRELTCTLMFEIDDLNPGKPAPPPFRIPGHQAQRPVFIRRWMPVHSSTSRQIFSSIQSTAASSAYADASTDL